MLHNLMKYNICAQKYRRFGVWQLHHPLKLQSSKHEMRENLLEEWRNVHLL